MQRGEGERDCDLFLFTRLLATKSWKVHVKLSILMYGESEMETHKPRSGAESTKEASRNVWRSDQELGAQCTLEERRRRKSGVAISQEAHMQGIEQLAKAHLERNVTRMFHSGTNGWFSEKDLSYIEVITSGQRLPVAMRAALTSDRPTRLWQSMAWRWTSTFGNTSWRQRCSGLCERPARVCLDSGATNASSAVDAH